LNDVIHVRDGAEALDYLRCEGKFAGAMHGGPVVVLLDLKLPKVNGLEVLEQVRGDPQLSSTPIVMLTSSREEQDLVQLRTGRQCIRGQAGRLQGILRRHPGAGHVLGITNQPPPHRPNGSGSTMRDGSRRSERLRILMLEDSALDAELITAQLQRAGLDFEAERLWTRNAFIEAIDSRAFDVILADHVLPGFDGDAASHWHASGSRTRLSSSSPAR
jgi:CheY-like chemotaxis protein